MRQNPSQPSSTGTPCPSSSPGAAFGAAPKVGDESRFDSLIQKYADKYGLPRLLIKAQIWAESIFNPQAVSSCGAKGLMQLMPETAKGMDEGMRWGGNEGKETNLFDPETNIELGVKYDRWLYDRFPEIPDTDERLKFMLAAYNCGRGYVNAALRLAREEEFGYQPLAARPGRWQTWEFTCRLLASPYCFVGGSGRRRHPDFCQVWDYVEKIWRKYQGYIQKGGDTK